MSVFVSIGTWAQSLTIYCPGPDQLSDSDINYDFSSYTEVVLTGSWGNNDLGKVKNKVNNTSVTTIDASNATFAYNAYAWPTPSSCQNFSEFNTLKHVVISSNTNDSNNPYSNNMFPSSIETVTYKGVVANISGSNATIQTSGSTPTTDENFLKTLLEDNGKTVTMEAAAQTNWDSTTQTLTLSESDADDIASLTNLYGSADNIKKVVFPDGSVWERDTDDLTKGTLTTTQDPDTHASVLEAAGLPVTTTTTVQVLGKYVSIVDGKTILTIPDDETGDVVTSTPANSTKLTQAEKNALAAATDLVVKGNLTDTDWGGLNTNLTNVTTLDLHDAMISQNCKLSGQIKASVENLTLPANPNYTSVPQQFAYQAASLSNVTFPDQITVINAQAFFQCPALQTVALPDNLTTIGPEAFSKSGLTELVLPGSLTSVGHDAFFQCEDLENVEMEMLNGSCTFDYEAFGSCFQLKHVTLSEGVTSIPDQMFDKCGMLESIRIPSTCRTIGEEAFNICASLHNIVIPEGVQLIKHGAFANSGITDVYVMATSTESVPKIYSMGHGNQGSDTGTFGSGMVTSNSADPYGKHSGDIGTADEETILSWYQEEMSDGRLGVGGGNCMVRLHYPENMRYFYDGYENPLSDAQNKTGWESPEDRLSESVLAAKMAAINSGDTHYISDGYAAGDNQYPAFGTDKDGNYWPRATDYYLRLESGDPAIYGLSEPSSMGWRQLPIQTTSRPDDYIFSKEYDDTWYTMCFPWDMEDNTLFSAFNQKLEITEFVGVEVVDVTTNEEKAENKESYNLIFHFDEVAGTYYVTENHLTDGLRYERVNDYTVDGSPTTRVEEVQTAAGTIEKKYYTYHRVEGSEGPEYVYWPFNMPADKKDYTDDQAAMAERYLDILHIMVFAGHPYMIHPSVGANPIKPPVKCVIAGVTKLPAEQIATLAEENKVTKRTTTDGKAYHQPGNTYFKDESYYTFIGNVDDYEDGVTPRKMMTSADSPYAYFLAVDLTNGKDPSDPKSIYPKYYRKSNANESQPSWSQYSAIIRPDANAIESIEKFIEINSNGGSSSGVNGFDVQFGEWEVVTPDAIEEIIFEAEKNNQPVKRINVNAVFNIKGQVVREGTSVEGLPRGLYIVNGKKYMVN